VHAAGDNFIVFHSYFLILFLSFSRVKTLISLKLGAIALPKMSQMTLPVSKWLHSKELFQWQHREFFGDRAE